MNSQNLKTILVAEDDKFLQSAYLAKLTKSGYQVLLANNGQEVIAHLKKKIPDFIILDLIMPILDGFEVLKALKKEPKYSKIPVLVTSNLGQDEDIDKCFTLGATDYIVKSDLSMSGLVEKIKKILI